MNCPDLSSLSRVGTPRADPSVVEHLKRCPSCWMDWQIQQGTRLLRRRANDAHDLSDLNDAVMAEVAIAEQRFDVPAGLVELAVSALLIAAAVMLFLGFPLGGLAAVPFGHAVAYAIAGGTAGALYCRRRDRRAFQIHSK